MEQIRENSHWRGGAIGGGGYDAVPSNTITSFFIVSSEIHEVTSTISDGN
jgi:hypothetical protein